jgi:hypothetical protein
MTKEASDQGITMTMPDNTVHLFYEDKSYKILLLQNVVTHDLERVLKERFNHVRNSYYKNIEEEMYFYGSSFYHE